MPELQKAVEQGGGVRTLYLIDRLEEMEPGRALGGQEDRPRSRNPTPFGLGTDRAGHRSGGWIPRSARPLGWMAPGEFKVFPVAELEEAKAWIPGRGAAWPIFGGPRIRQLVRSSCP
jgi:hypothetical protein